jgi:hypothetical protein
MSGEVFDEKFPRKFWKKFELFFLFLINTWATYRRSAWNSSVKPWLYMYWHFLTSWNILYLVISVTVYGLEFGTAVERVAWKLLDCYIYIPIADTSLLNKTTHQLRTEKLLPISCERNAGLSNGHGVISIFNTVKCHSQLLGSISFRYF